MDKPIWHAPFLIYPLASPWWWGFCGLEHPLFLSSSQRRRKPVSLPLFYWLQFFRPGATRRGEWLRCHTGLGNNRRGRDICCGREETSRFGTFWKSRIVSRSARKFLIFMFFLWWFPLELSVYVYQQKYILLKNHFHGFREIQCLVCHLQWRSCHSALFVSNKSRGPPRTTRPIISMCTVHITAFYILWHSKGGIIFCLNLFFVTWWICTRWNWLYTW